VAGLTDGRTVLAAMRPFRGLYHTISDVVLIGGGPVLLPGEVLLAAMPDQAGLKPKDLIDT
jgi:predicted ATPase with chaperone activity